MQTIITKYVGETEKRGSRIVASASGIRGFKGRISIPDGDVTDDAVQHKLAVVALCKKLNWTGDFIGGHTKDGMVWVFNTTISPKVCVEGYRKDGSVIFNTSDEPWERMKG